MALYHLPSGCVAHRQRKEQRCGCSLMDYRPLQVKLTSALICLDMGKGNEELNPSKDMFKSASKKKHCCVNLQAPACVLLVKREVWQGNNGKVGASRTVAKAGAGWEC